MCFLINISFFQLSLSFYEGKIKLIFFKIKYFEPRKIVQIFFAFCILVILKSEFICFQ